MDQYVLHISSWYPSVKHQSLGNFVRRHIRAANQKSKSILIHPVPLKGLSEMELLEEDANGFKELYVYYPEMANSNSIFTFYNKWKALGKAYKFGVDYLLKNYGKPKLMHLHIAYPHGYFAKKIASKLKLSYLITEHWTGYTMEDGDYANAGFIRKIITRSIYRSSSINLPVSAHLGESLRRHKLIKNYEVVPNVVDARLFSAGKEERGPHRFLHVSNFRNRQKNLEGILRVLGSVVKNALDFELVLVGEESNPELEGYIEKYNLQSKVKMHFQLTEAEVAQTMRKCDTFILFSYFENLPCVLIEARSTGMNLITTGVGGIPEFFSNMDGVEIVEPGNDKSLRHAIEKVIQTKPNDEKRIARHDDAANVFGREKIAQSLANFYKELVG